MDNKSKIVSRVFTQAEAKYLFGRFEDVHCHAKFATEKGEEEICCPGWDWKLTHLDDSNQEQKGGCRYKNSDKLCTLLRLASEDMFVVDIRPKNEEDIRKERAMERSLLMSEIAQLKRGRDSLEEKILTLESKVKDFL